MEDAAKRSPKASEPAGAFPVAVGEGKPAPAATRAEVAAPVTEQIMEP